MFREVKILTIILPLLCIVVSKNLTLHDFDNPSATHILDATVHNDLLIVSGMIGGIEFYDISNPQVLSHLDNLQLSNGGGGGGNMSRMMCTMDSECDRNAGETCCDIPNRGQYCLDQQACRDAQSGGGSGSA